MNFKNDMYKYVAILHALGAKSLKPENGERNRGFSAPPQLAQVFRSCKPYDRLLGPYLTT